ncbi:flagellar biosynthetic protein FliO [Desulfacinum infernum DSM 9756]|uniref:Flagellar protein n=1 Tax=Desulfacinum infernum DSM 9756 TaxID=1121391 RepID=A0A1M4UWI9_9BACT|nr:flagellar biosynthetic protein FliO [Desulfacinum infernum]MBC7357725.1 flagellar biosynthetic protein FliO [Desulfacinum sp.]SHE61048.1 flagellar biosynthetic protein FliO [Desulfacinum infernum DSM 9756]
MDFALHFLQTAAALALVVALLLGFSHVVKRFGWPLSKGQGTSHIRVLERRFLTNKHSLVLVRVQGERLLIGVSPNGMELLASLADRPEESADLRAEGDVP